MCSHTGPDVVLVCVHLFKYVTRRYPLPIVFCGPNVVSIFVYVLRYVCIYMCRSLSIIRVLMSVRVLRHVCIQICMYSHMKLLIQIPALSISDATTVCVDVGVVVGL